VALDDSFARVSRRFGLSPHQAEFLCAAMQPGPVGDIARVVRSDRSAVTRMADRAADRGLIVRRRGDEDGRVVVIELTPEGMELAREFIDALQSELAGLLATWTPHRTRLAASIINDLSGGLERRGEEIAGDPAPPPWRVSRRGAGNSSSALLRD
jgi:cytochrome b561